MGGILGNRAFYFQNWNATGATLRTPNTPITDVTFTSANAQVTASYKGLGLSNNSNAYANNSQRKFVRTDDGWLHNVYESLGRVWYEISSDNGATWFIANGGKALDNGEGKLPSIDYSAKLSSEGGIIAYQTVVIYQEKYGSSSKIKVKYFQKGLSGGFNFVSDYVIDEPGTYSSLNATPVIGFSHGNVFTAVWKRIGAKLWCFYGGIGSTGIISPIYGPNDLNGTTTNSINPTIYVKKTGTTQDKKIAWEETGSGGAASIKYGVITLSNIVDPNTISTVSADNGFLKNYQPSIIELNGGARLCWIGYRNTPGDTYTTVFRDASGGQFWNFGGNVRSVNINRTADNNYVVAWSRFSGSTYVNEYTRNTSLSTIRNFVTTGKDFQINNGADFNSQYALSYSTGASLPYYFTKSNSVGSIGKESSESAVASGRQGVIGKENAQFYFVLGDIEANGSNIEFDEMSDTTMVNDLTGLNKYLITKPFEINDKADFSYSIQYGVTSSEEAVSVLKKDKEISFRVHLIEEKSGDIITEFNNINFNKNNIFSDNESYKIKIGKSDIKTVRLKVIAEVNSDQSEYAYSLTHIYSTDDAVAKASAKELTAELFSTPVDYSLSQNYPSPFNPTTTITYQLPMDGIVTLKIYDAIGTEITTLVNEFKTTGSYNVQFNASSLASGVYFYKINVNDYSSTRKLILMK